MDAKVFCHNYRVTYADCTLGDHVYYSRYLNLLETARGEFFRQLGAPLLRLQQEEIIFPVIECRLRYKAPARYDDLLVIELWVSAVESVRLNFAYRVLNQSGALVVEAETFHACAGLNEKPKRLPEDLGKLLREYLRAG